MSAAGDILVTGGTGFLGQHLAAALLRRGLRVRLMGRDFRGCRELIASGAVPIRADLRERDAVIAACQGCDAVYHAGALSAPWGDSRTFYAVNVGGTEAVIEGCQRHIVRRLIYISSPSVLFDGRDQFDLPDDAPYPENFLSPYSLTKKIAEERVTDASAMGLETVTLRPKAIFGPGDRALMPRLVQAARRGRLPQIGNGRNRVDLTFVDNVVQSMLLALEAPSAAGRRYNITNGEHPLLWDVIRQVLEQLDIPAPRRHLPRRAAMGLASIMEWQAKWSGVEPLLTRYTVAILASTQTYDISAARRDLGYAPRIGLAEGIHRTVRAIRAS